MKQFDNDQSTMRIKRTLTSEVNTQRTPGEQKTQTVPGERQGFRQVTKRKGTV